MEFLTVSVSRIISKWFSWGLVEAIWLNCWWIVWKNQFYKFSWTTYQLIEMDGYISLMSKAKSEALSQKASNRIVLEKKIIGRGQISLAGFDDKKIWKYYVDSTWKGVHSENKPRMITMKMIWIFSSIQRIRSPQSLNVFKSLQFFFDSTKSAMSSDQHCYKSFYLLKKSEDHY